MPITKNISRADVAHTFREDCRRFCLSALETPEKGCLAARFRQYSPRQNALKTAQTLGFDGFRSNTTYLYEAISGHNSSSVRQPT
jgi:hypothetical protein